MQPAVGDDIQGGGEKFLALSKKNTERSVNYGFISHIFHSDLHTYFNGTSVFLSLKKRTLKAGTSTEPL